MKYLNVFQLRNELTTQSVDDLAKKHGVPIAHLHNFIYSHVNRTGTYPVDGTRSRAAITPRTNQGRVTSRKERLIKAISKQYNIPENELTDIYNRIYKN